MHPLPRKSIHYLDADSCSRGLIPGFQVKELNRYDYSGYGVSTGEKFCNRLRKTKSVGEGQMQKTVNRGKDPESVQEGQKVVDRGKERSRGTKAEIVVV
ncbi:hypothetical protein L6452_02797 [Arctium lappa]|uniref:Uncharacterized protein n=1 Tax=Arctium lappa TaxID=4217 RepID=A0ACB9FLB9_ARCLA|nr:hypothetical protein L6452_02797 [Arctium lappa]